MRRRHTTPTIRAAGVAATVLLGACSSDRPVAPPDASSDRGGPAAKESVPMKGTYEARGTGRVGAAGCAGTLFTFSGGGNETHSGRYAIENFSCSIADPANPNAGTFTGGFTKTAANGDLLVGTYTGTFSVTGAVGPVVTIALRGTLIFTGGTGRFAGASGEQTMVGEQTTNFATPDLASRVVLRLDGTISSVGSLP